LSVSDLWSFCGLDGGNCVKAGKNVEQVKVTIENPRTSSPRVVVVVKITGGNNESMCRQPPLSCSARKMY
jgi:hypothetical protein